MIYHGYTYCFSVLKLEPQNPDSVSVPLVDLQIFVKDRGEGELLSYHSSLPHEKGVESASPSLKGQELRAILAVT